MSELKAGELKINNVPVRFKAVAYTHHHLEAPVPATEELRDYIIKLKQHHFNTILVYGLPVNNDLYKLADEYGLYLIQYLDADKYEISQDESKSNVWLRQRLSMLYQIRNRLSLIACATEDRILVTSKLQHLALQDSLKALDPDRPILHEGESKAVANLLSSAPKLEQLTAENLYKLKKEYQPVSMKISKDSSVSLFNVQDFAMLDKVVLQWKVTDGDKVVLQGEEGSISIKPGKSQLVKLPFSFNTFKDKDNGYTLQFEVKLKEDIPWAEKGFVLAWERFDANALHLSY